MTYYKGTMKDKIFLLLLLTYQTFLEVRDRVFRKRFKKTYIKPWMRYRELEVLEEVITNLQPKRCLEWGSGYSTIIFPKLIHRDFKWIALEHNEEWANKIKGMNQRSNVEIHYVPTVSTSKEKKNIDRPEYTRYVEYPSKFGKFDFIFVDGRARKDCLIKARELLNDEGVVILHDANRERYHEPFELYQQKALFTDLRKGGGGIWVGSKRRELNEVLEVDKHTALWKLYRKAEKICTKI